MRLLRVKINPQKSHDICYIQPPHPPMNITEFAEQIVFGKTLDDKLIVPGRLTHDTNRPRAMRVESLPSPGRARGLKMKHGKGENVPPPSDEQLENESARGQLLHFLANHELLATELMALTLLKFPDAPLAFRQGILVTLQEEQEHTRMYMRRMKECGVEFGSFPLSGQFWRAVEPMQSPMDFVSRLSLTFEQANLDYSLHFAGVFGKIGDAETAQLLQKIYEDEIGHVQHGLHWFRQWKNPDQTDWEAYQRQLEFPLSPQRGRGPRGAFNRDGRVQAGLSEDFIDAMEVFRQSRGRAPSIRWFDPAAEIELAERNSRSKRRETSGHSADTPEFSRIGQPQKSANLLNQLAIDLELTMIAMARQDDVMLVRRLPSRDIRKQLIDAGFDLPEFVRFEDADELTDRKLHDFVPWAWTPHNIAIAEPLIDSAHHAPPAWNEAQTELFGKSWSTNSLRKWLVEGSDPLPDWLCSADCVGTAVHSTEDIPHAISKLTDLGYKTAIAKTNLSASGRGQRRLDCRQPLSSQDTAWLHSALCGSEVSRRSATSIVIEPELNRIVDLSFLWHLDRDSETANYLGWTRQLVTGGRRYAGTRLGTPLDGCDENKLVSAGASTSLAGDSTSHESVKRFLLADRGARLQAVADWLHERIVPELRSRNFSGHFGVDTFVYRDDGADTFQREPQPPETMSSFTKLKIKPLVELNPRTTMGHIALRLGKQLSRGAEGLFTILKKPQWNRLHESLSQVPMQRASDGLTSGAIWLGEVTPQTKLIPVLLVGKRAIVQLDKKEP